MHNPDRNNTTSEIHNRKSNKITKDRSMRISHKKTGSAKGSASLVLHMTFVVYNDDTTTIGNRGLEISMLKLKHGILRFKHQYIIVFFNYKFLYVLFTCMSIFLLKIQFPVNLIYFCIFRKIATL